MSTGTLAAASYVDTELRPIQLDNKDGLAVTLASEPAVRNIWRQTEDLLRGTVTGEANLTPAFQQRQAAPLRNVYVVAPGFVITSGDYQRRFEGLPIEEYRDRMPPEVFEAYIRYVGLIDGGPDLDVVEAANVPPG